MLAPGTLLQNRYRVVRLLGEGGMGAVYESVDQRFDDATVALKQTTVRGEELLRAFRREGQLLNSLRHPALPIVTDYFVEGDDAYLVMDFVPGQDLANALASNGRPFTPDEVAPWADQVLAALEYLHSHEPPILHRDLKPQNLKLTPNGSLKVLDFGISKGTKWLGSATPDGTSVRAYTPHYAPLEQIRGKGTDVRSDIYAVAATLYHLLTGQVPPDALERAAGLYTVNNDPLELPHRIRPHVPHALSHLIGEALSIDAQARPGSASEFRRRLRAAFADSGTNAGADELPTRRTPAPPTVDTEVATRAMWPTVVDEPATVGLGGLTEVAVRESQPMAKPVTRSFFNRERPVVMWIFMVLLGLATIGFVAAIIIGLAVAGKLPF